MFQASSIEERVKLWTILYRIRIRLFIMNLPILAIICICKLTKFVIFSLFGSLDCSHNGLDYWALVPIYS